MFPILYNKIGEDLPLPSGSDYILMKNVEIAKDFTKF